MCSSLLFIVILLGITEATGQRSHVGMMHKLRAAACYTNMSWCNQVTPHIPWGMQGERLMFVTVPKNLIEDPDFILLFTCPERVCVCVWMWMITWLTMGRNMCHYNLSLNNLYLNLNLYWTLIITLKKCNHLILISVVKL